VLEPHEARPLGVLVLQPGDQPQSVRVVGVAGEVLRRGIRIACTDAGEVRDGAEAAGPDQVAEDVVPRQSGWMP
jgi:hypothetical protein